MMRAALLLSIFIFTVSGEISRQTKTEAVVTHEVGKVRADILEETILTYLQKEEFDQATDLIANLIYDNQLDNSLLALAGIVQYGDTVLIEKLGEVMELLNEKYYDVNRQLLITALNRTGQSPESTICPQSLANVGLCRKETSISRTLLQQVKASQVSDGFQVEEVSKNDDFGEVQTSPKSKPGNDYFWTLKSGDYKSAAWIIIENAQNFEVQDFARAINQAVIDGAGGPAGESLLEALKLAEGQGVSGQVASLVAQLLMQNYRKDVIPMVSKAVALASRNGRDNVVQRLVRAGIEQNGKVRSTAEVMNWVAAQGGRTGVKDMAIALVGAEEQGKVGMLAELLAYAVCRGGVFWDSFSRIYDKAVDLYNCGAIEKSFKQGITSTENSCPQNLPKNFYVGTSLLQNCNLIDNYSSSTPTESTVLIIDSENSSQEDEDIETQSITTETNQLSPDKKKSPVALATPASEPVQDINHGDDKVIDIQQESEQNVEQDQDNDALRNQSIQFEDNFNQQGASSMQNRSSDSTQVGESLSVLQLFMESLQQGINDEQKNDTSNINIDISSNQSLDSNESEVPIQQNASLAASGIDQNSCSDVLPQDELNANCEERSKWGGCEKQWMINNNYCARTCGFCVKDEADENKSLNDANDFLAIPIPNNANKRDLNDSLFSTSRLEEEAVEFTRTSMSAATNGEQQQNEAQSIEQNQPSTEDSKQQKQRDFGQQCTDTIPSDNSTATCEERKSWGGCEKKWMKDENYCALTCGFCQLTSRQVPISQPIQQQELAQQADVSASPSSMGLLAMIANKLQDNQVSEMKIKHTPEEDGNVVDNKDLFCVDSRPKDDEDISCQQRKEWGACEKAWMIQGNYCSKTCGYCTDLIYKQPIEKSIFSLAPVQESENNDKQPSSASIPITNFNFEQNLTIEESDDTSEIKRKRSSGSTNNDLVEEVEKQVFCVDVVPESESKSSCQQFKEWGACQKEWMMQEQYCAKTCGYCTTSDSEVVSASINQERSKLSKEEFNNIQFLSVQPTNNEDISKLEAGETSAFEIRSQQIAGLDETYLQEEVGKQIICVDALPEGGEEVSCQQRKQWGACEKEWVIDGNYCAKTCGRCDN